MAQWERLNEWVEYKRCDSSSCCKRCSKTSSNTKTRRIKKNTVSFSVVVGLKLGDELSVLARLKVPYVGVVAKELKTVFLGFFGSYCTNFLNSYG